jgi:RNA polymerase I-specific transcription initiation factor RRN7
MLTRVFSVPRSPGEVLLLSVPAAAVSQAGGGSHASLGAASRVQCAFISVRSTVTLEAEILQIICRDLWALNLRLLPNPPSPEPLDWTQSECVDKAALDSDEDSPAKRESRPFDPGMLSAAKAESSNAGEDEDEAHRREETELEELRALIDDSEPSTSEEDSTSEDENELAPEDVGEGEDGDSESDGEPKKKPRPRKPVKTRREEKPLAGLAVLVVACWTMRVPVMYRDFIE